MRLSRNILILTFVELLLLLLVQTAAGQTSDSLRFARLQKDMYRHYSTHNTKEFLQTVEQLKVLARKAGQEKLYYKAYGNQAIYTSSYINRGEGVEIAKALYRKAEQEHSRYGLYTANYVLGTIYTYIRHLQMKRLKEAYDKLEETTAAKERIESELRIARSIQMAMVPHEFPESKRLNIYASMTPAKEVGGDLYDFVVIGDKLYFCLGDVSGKGVPAALFMAMSIRLFRTLCKYQLKPAEIAMSMNNELALNNENGMFVTMFIGLLDLTSGRLDFCNAGHNPPVLNGNFINMEPNAPLGLWEGLDYEGKTLENIRGKQFFVYSDGLNEAENDAQDQYSDDRLLNFLKGHTDMAAHPLIDLLMEDVGHHVDGADPSDDMTMLCLRMK